MAETVMRECTSCYMSLPLEAFSAAQRGRGGLSSNCKACNSERVSVRKHGITSLEKELLADDQNGCGICGRTTPGAKGWVVDHDRACCPGERSCPQCRRGILCQWCNVALAFVHDNPITARRMADYIELRTILRTGSEPETATDSTARSNVHNEQNELGRTYEAVQDVDLSGSFAERVRAYQRFNIRCPEEIR